MALTAEELAVALRLAASDPSGTVQVDTDIQARLTRQNAVAAALITHYAPDAPTAVQEEAAIVFAGYVYNKPTVHGYGLASAFVNSGAAALLSQWHAERSAALDPASDLAVYEAETMLTAESRDVRQQTFTDFTTDIDLSGISWARAAYLSACSYQARVAGAMPRRGLCIPRPDRPEP